MAAAGKTTKRTKVAQPRGATFATVCKLASAFPGVEQGLSWGTPGLKVKGRFMARMKEDGESLVLRMGLQERQALMRQSPAVLIRLPKIARSVLAKVVAESWRQVAAESLVAEHDDHKKKRRLR
jgi:hypothetical protein